MDFSAILLAAVLDGAPCFGRPLSDTRLDSSGRVRPLAETGLKFPLEVWLRCPPRQPFRSVVSV